MNKIETEELKKLQIQILKNVSGFCDKYNIRYFLSYGTLIGAIRHNGYIPWDDDIDICMPRPDYERFLSLYNKESETFKVIEHRIDENYKLPFAKVHDTKTVMNELLYIKDSFGVYIDVFPIDAVKSPKQLKLSFIWNKFLNTKRAIIDNKRPVSKNIIIYLGKIILFPLSINFILNQINKVARQASFEKSLYAANIVSSYGECEIMPKLFYSEYIKHTFEDEKYNIPKEYHSILTKTYGNYMQLPPIEKRITHHTFKAWWKE